MTTPPELPSLTAGFAPAGRDAWMELVTKALKGGDFNRRLVSETADGLAIEPIYPRRPDGVVTVRADGAAPWQITARVDHPDRKAAAALAVADLEGGASGLALVFADSLAARGFGLDTASVADLDRALAGVMLDLIAVRIEPGAAGRVNAGLVAALVARRGYEPKRMRINFGLDPIGVLAVRGSFPATWQEAERRLCETVRTLTHNGFVGPFIVCDLRPFSEAGASEAQELGVALAAGVAYARALEAGGITVTDAFRVLSWTLAVDADQLMGLAKLRALRRLWARVEAAAGAPARPITIHAETAWRMLTKRDPAVNMLRATTAVFAAGAGGADSIAVLPHSSALGLADALSRRIARNTQLVLQEETNLWRVADPGAGSGAIEGLTEELCRAGWQHFQDIEREGGLVASLAAGALQARIAAVAAARMHDVASRKAPITGTSEFPNLADTQGGTLDVAPLARPPEQPLQAGARLLDFDGLVAALQAGAARADVAQPPMPALQAAPLPSRRLAEPFEALRAAAEAAGGTAKVFLANLGALAEHGGRATWISNLLAAGGIAVATNDGFAASGEVGAAFAASGTKVACICGSDETYGQLAEAVAQALQSAGAGYIMLAGRPGAGEAAFKAAGVDQFLFAGQDVVAALRRVHAALGISSQ